METLLGGAAASAEDDDDQGKAFDDKCKEYASC
jgi:hypothetical protein